jgi:potassium/hydrogen antiporter
MTNYIILVLCIIVILSYIFEVSSKFSKIPGVIMLIGLGIIIRLLADNTGIEIPNLQPLLPVIGTIGLILIVLEASLDLKIEKEKMGLLYKSFSSAILLFLIMVIISAFVLVQFMGFQLKEAIINVIPLGIISSAVAIPASKNLSSYQKEFIVYESSISDIIGIMTFDFIILYSGPFAKEIGNLIFSGILTLGVAVITTSFLAILLHKITYHVNHVIIMTSVILVYVLAKLIHFPSLLLVLAFGLTLSNNTLVEKTFIKRYIDFEKFGNDLNSFKQITIELTFLVRSFFFVMFGFFTTINGLTDIDNLLTGLIITCGIYILRWLYFSIVLKIYNPSLILFAPRGLITILLFLSIPATLKISFINTEVTTIVIMFTLLIMMIGNIFSKKDSLPNNSSMINRN